MRKTSELLQILLDKIYNVKKCGGLCRLVTSLFQCRILYPGEDELLLEYLRNNRPKFNKSNPWMLFNGHPCFWYIPKAVYPRKQWLKKHIKLCKEKGD